jgi:phosphate-selective porin OprO/OprP
VVFLNPKIKNGEGSMRLSKISLAVSAIFALSAAPAVFAIDLYMDTKTEQLYAKPGPGRVHLGNFVKEGPAPKEGPALKTGGVSASATAETDNALEKTAEIMQAQKDAELAAMR